MVDTATMAPPISSLRAYLDHLRARREAIVRQRTEEVLQTLAAADEPARAQGMRQLQFDLIAQTADLDRQILDVAVTVAKFGNGVGS